MNEPQPDPVRQALDDIYRREARRVFATLVRLLGDLDQAEEALHEAFRAALEQWPREGLPDNPRAWLVSAGRFKAIDSQRRQARFSSLEDQPGAADALLAMEPEPDEHAVADDPLRLVFTCCHPALQPEAQVALTLREVCGLATEQIASAFLVTTPTLAQRIVRAKGKIRTAGIPYEVPGRAELPARLDSVLRVVYLVFNEGYAASAGDSLLRQDLSAEAIRLGRLLVDLLPEPEALGLLALMLLHESRRPARVTADGDLVPLEEQDRSLWDRALINEGLALVDRAFAGGEIGPYTLQAAIAALHAGVESAGDTDWVEIAGLYELLARAQPSPVVELNRAAAIAMRDGPAVGLALIDALLARGELAGYHLAHAARADLCRRLGRHREARAAYAQALALVRQDPERRYLQRRLAALPQ